MYLIPTLETYHGLEITIIITAFWFPIYWIFGGVIFATLAFFRVTKLRKVRFSCLFSLLSLACAIGAAYFGMQFGHDQINSCLNKTTGFVDSLSAVIGCGIISIFLAGAIGFVVLILLGLLIMFICRAANQSWIDSDEEAKEKIVVVFDSE